MPPLGSVLAATVVRLLMVMVMLMTAWEPWQLRPRALCNREGRRGDRGAAIIGKGVARAAIVKGVE